MSPNASPGGRTRLPWPLRLFLLGKVQLDGIGRGIGRDLDRRGPDYRGRFAKAFGSFVAIVVAAGNLQGGFAGGGDQRQNNVELGLGFIDC